MNIVKIASTSRDGGLQGEVNLIRFEQGGIVTFVLEYTDDGYRYEWWHFINKESYQAYLNDASKPRYETVEPKFVQEPSEELMSFLLHPGPAENHPLHIKNAVPKGLADDVQP